MQKIRVLIADDHYFVRKGIMMVLAAEPRVEIAGEAGTGIEVIEQVKTLQPDVVLMDLSMPHGGGIKAISTIKNIFPRTSIIVLTMHQDEGNINAALKAGADGYLLKDANDGSLLKAIFAVHGGDMPLHPHVARQLLNGMGKRNVPEPAGANLTEREIEVLALVSQGMSNKAVAQKLHLSSGTIKIHVSNILSKLNVSSRTEAAVQAIQLGLIPE